MINLHSKFLILYFYSEKQMTKYFKSFKIAEQSSLLRYPQHLKKHHLINISDK